MEKLAAHYTALAFVDEVETLCGRPFEDEVREYLYKEAMFNLSTVAAKGKEFIRKGQEMVKNPAAAASGITQAAQRAAVKAQSSQAWQTAAMNPAAAAFNMGGDLVNMAAAKVIGGGLGAAAKSAQPGKLQTGLNTMSSFAGAMG
jgi:hypothetical protein